MSGPSNLTGPPDLIEDNNKREYYLSYKKMSESV